MHLLVRHWDHRPPCLPPTPSSFQHFFLEKVHNVQEFGDFGPFRIGWCTNSENNLRVMGLGPLGVSLHSQGKILLVSGIAKDKVKAGCF